MERLHYIYGLYSTQEPKKMRYIGQTNNPSSRLKQHINAAEFKDTKSILYDWMRKEIKAGYHIRMTCLTQCEYDEKNKMEREYMDKYKGDLLNTTAYEDNSTYNLHTKLSEVKEELDRVKESKVEKVIIEKEVIIEKIIEKKVFAEPTFVNTNLPGENRSMRKTNKTLQQPYMDAFRLLNGG